ncbi:MAG TPA: DUF1800 domain-containing protein [Ktedonobacterales bacterium]
MNDQSFGERPTQPLGFGAPAGPEITAENTVDSLPTAPYQAPGAAPANDKLPWEQSGNMSWPPPGGANQQVDGGSTGGLIKGAQMNGAAPRRKRGSGPHVSRRTLLVGAGVAGLASVAVAAGITVHNLTSSHESGGQVSDNEKFAHLLRRAGFGAGPGDISAYSALGTNGAVDRLLNFDKISNAALDQHIAAANFDYTNFTDIQTWWLTRMLYSAHPLEEKMTLFWHGLLTSSVAKVGGKRGYPLLKQQNDFLRQNAFGRFDDLLAGITIDPAMLLWLDGNRSLKGSPNENFAREEMELFSMGVGNYTQTDIEQSARALTGWVINPLTGKAVLRPQFHDDGSKTFLGQTGNFDYKDIARIICSQAVTPKFLSTRLWRFFAYENPSAADIQPLMDAWHSSNHSIKAMMQALLTSPAFYSTKAYRSRIKSPVEFIVGGFRNLGLGGIEQAGKKLLGAMNIMGQILYDPPNVAGWPGDQVSANWVNTGAWMTRVNTINALVDYMSASPDFNKQLQADIQKQQIDSADKLVTYVLTQLIDGQIDSPRRQMLVDYVNGSSAGGTDRLTLYGGKAISGNSVRGLYYLIMSMPEYQLN